MSILPKQRPVSSYGQLEAYIDKHKGEVHGSMPVRRTYSETILEVSVDGKFHKPPAKNTETGTNTEEADLIEFQPYSDQHPTFTNPQIVSEKTFAASSLIKVSVHSRHKIIPQ